MGKNRKEKQKIVVKNRPKETIPLIVSYDKGNDEPILIIGRKNFVTDMVEIINFFQGSEATELYEKLAKKDDKV